MAYYAHTPKRPESEEWHSLEEHLRATAELCARFSLRFGEADGFAAGLLHDFGKYQPEFQQYLNKSHAGCEDAGRAPHAAAGALWALERNQHALAFVIAAHHGRLKLPTDVVNALQDDATRKRMDAAIREAPGWIKNHVLEPNPPRRTALWIRLLFSALVDADSLDTERYCVGYERPSCKASLGELLEKLEHHLGAIGQGVVSPMNSLRREVQEAARAAAELPQGSFRLTVPTGGGKTLAALLFALKHAVRWNLERVFVVIPYTSIIDQTVAVYRSILGEDAVLEHHSNLDPEQESIENRLATENWDRPIVVTTSVQLLETMFADHKRRLRKLHRVAGSVVVFDEVQTFDLERLGPIQQGLRQLWEKFDASLVYCTATQPLLIDREEAVEIVPNPKRLFETVRERVRVNWPQSLKEPTSWSTLAERISNEPGDRVLAIVNKRSDAIELATLLGEGCIHLSALLCAEHRREKLALIRRLLDENAPCLVVSTQLVEAGVDLDFPVVYRALAGYDSLAQAAGRCNREGRLPQGRLEIFVPESTEPRYLKKRTGCTRTLLVERGERDLFDNDVYGKYFAELLRSVHIDRNGVCVLEEQYNFPEVARKFALIEDSTEPVIAPWPGAAERVAELRSGVTVQRLRALQPYTVGLYPAEIARLQGQGVLDPLLPWKDDSRSWCVLESQASDVYDDRFGFGHAPSMVEIGLMVE